MLSPLSTLSPAEWFSERTAAAWQEFQALPVPGIKDEHWRYSNAKRIELDTLVNATEAPMDIVEQAVGCSVGIGSTAATFIFVNDQLAASNTEGLPQGVVCVTLAEAM